MHARDLYSSLDTKIYAARAFICKHILHKHAFPLTIFVTFGA
jgi:hypothetical protein